MGKMSRQAAKSLDLMPAGVHIPLDGLAYEHERRDVAGLLASVQEKCGAGAVCLGLAGFSMPAEWEMRRDMLSNRGTTHWDELASVRIG